jgi:ribosome-binding factor A
VKLRVAEDIRQKLAHLLLRELDDPRLDGLHLTRVEMTPDLTLARVFWRLLPGVGRREAAEAAMKSASPFLRRKLGASLRLRGVPQLDFRFDEMVDTGDRIEGLLAGMAPNPAAGLDDEE